MIILGADLSLKSSGLVWYDTGRNKVIQERTLSVYKKSLATIQEDFEMAIWPMHVYVDLAVVETALYRSLDESNTLFRYTLERNGIKYKSIHPKTLRKALLGNGSATKEEVAKWLKRKYKISFDNDPGYDLSDAAACAVWGSLNA